MDNWNMQIFVFHLVVFVLYASTLLYDSFYLEIMPSRESYAGRFKYLTFWNELIQFTYFGIAVINSLFGSNFNQNQQRSNPENYTQLQRVKDFFAATIAFPVGLFVVLTFWSLYAFDRELVYPAVLDKIIPSWLNHMWHTCVIVFTVTEKMIVYQKYPSTGRGLVTLAAFGLTYLSWVFWIAYRANIWVYPVLEVLAWPQRVVFILGCIFTMSLCYFVGQLITGVAWRQSTVDKKRE